MKARTALEHHLWKTLKEDRLEKARFCLSCSGGADSVAMVKAFAAVLPVSQLVVAHVHHGAGMNGNFRNEAEVFVRSLAQGLNISSEFRRHHGPELRGEAALRSCRRRFLTEIKAARDCDWVVTAHHADDVLETRLIRLMRGTGPDGLPALLRQRGFWYRPFLEISAEELRSDVVVSSLPWMEDPSNRDPRFLRNWIRHRWLPALERKRPGAKRAFARSLEDLSQRLEDSTEFRGGPLARTEWMSFHRSEQMRVLALWLRSVGVSDFTRGQLEEIRKQLDNSRNEYTFKGAGCLWLVNAGQIALRPGRRKT